MCKERLRLFVPSRLNSSQTVPSAWPSAARCEAACSQAAKKGGLKNHTISRYHLRPMCSTLRGCRK